MKEIVDVENSTDLVPESSSGADASEPSEVEQKLADEIKHLWAVHVDAQAVVKKTKAELKGIRQRLSESLHLMKELLVTPGCAGGRNGRWASFLRSQMIAISTADRLVRSYRQSVCPEPNMISDQVSEPTEIDAQRWFDLVWPGLKKKITTPRSAFDFLRRFVESSGLAHKSQGDGLIVFDPGVETLEKPSNVAEQPVVTAAASNCDVR